ACDVCGSQRMSQELFSPETAILPSTAVKSFVLPPLYYDRSSAIKALTAALLTTPVELIGIITDYYCRVKPSFDSALIIPAHTPRVQFSVDYRSATAPSGLRLRTTERILLVARYPLKMSVHKW